MIENLETLLALSQSGTMLKASTQLRVSQSTVSKRIALLEKYYGRKLIQKKGRNVELTVSGVQLAGKIPSLLTQLRDLFIDEGNESVGQLIVGVSESILSSWGPAVFLAAQKELNKSQLVFHAHRTAVVLDRIRSGEFNVGVCAGSLALDTDLQSEILFHEPMVIIPSKLKKTPWPSKKKLEVITIEDDSGSWRSIGVSAENLNIQRVLTLESFFSVAQMAIAGFGHGLVPIGVAKAFNIPTGSLIHPDNKILSRPVRFVARKSTYAQAPVTQFYRLLFHALQ